MRSCPLRTCETAFPGAREIFPDYKRQGFDLRNKSLSYFFTFYIRCHEPELVSAIGFRASEVCLLSSVCDISMLQPFLDSNDLSVEHRHYFGTTRCLREGKGRRQMSKMRSGMSLTELPQTSGHRSKRTVFRKSSPSFIT